MSETNSIARLLDQLSSSTAWQQAVSNQVVNFEPTPTPAAPKKDERPPESLRPNDSIESTDKAPPLVEPPSNRVGTLLDLLGSTTTSSKSINSRHNSEGDDKFVSSIRVGDATQRDLRHASFAEALQLVTELAQRPAVIKHLKEIRDEQKRLEQRYWESRQEILQKQRKAIEDLKTKVSITGTLGNREVKRLKTTFHKELSELEREEFLPAWDRLLSRQQSTLERMDIPLMFETTDPDERRMQQRIVNVLEGLMDGSP